MFSSPELNLNQANILPGMTVADLGCGVGMYAISAGKLVGDHGHVFAIDIQKDVLGRVANTAEAEGLKSVKIIWADIESPKGSTLAEDSVDRVVVANVLFLATERESIIREAYRILKPNGFLLVIDWSDSHSGLGPTKDMLVSKGFVKETSASVGFKYAKEIDAGEHHFGMLFKKE